MKLTRDTAFEVGWLAWQLRPPQPSLTVVVKASFALVPGGPCVVAPEQELVTGDEHPDDDLARSPRYATDLAVFKPRGECLLVGTCYPPGGRATVSAVAFRVGAVKRSLAVFGDRFWKTTLLGGVPEPAPFESMPLTWERAFGGPGHDPNPLGRGLADVEQADGKKRRPLPNVEDPADLVHERGARPRPAGTAPIPRTWKLRLARAGTYDARWLRTRWPYYPEDFDWEHENAAPPEQRIDGYWRGDEELGLRNLHPRHAVIDTRLPGVTPRCFLARHDGADGLEELVLRLDTITVDADRLRVLCVWRGVTEVESETLDDVAHLFVTAEEPGQRRSVEQHAARLAELLAAEEDEGLAEEPPAAEEETGEPHDERATMIDAGPPAATDAEPDPLVEKLAALDARLAALGILVPPPSGPRPPLGADALRKLRDSLLAAGLEPPPGIDELVAEREAAERPAPAEEPLPEPHRPRRSRELRRMVKERLKAGQPVSDLDLGEIDLSGVNLSGQDLSGCILAHANLRDCHLDGARLDGANLDHADLRGAYVRDASLRGCSFVEARTDVVNFDRSTLDGCDFTRARMTGATFSGASCQGALFEEALLYAALFEDAKLDETDFSGAAIEDVQMSRASLRHATLGGAWALRAVLDDADLTGLRATGETTLEHASFRRARAAGSQWQGASLVGADFSRAELSRADLSGAVLHQAVLHGAQLVQACLAGCVLVEASVLDANLFEARLEGADLSGADLRGSNLFGAELWKAQTEGARLELANVQRTKLEGRR